MEIADFDFQGGAVVLWDLAAISESTPLESDVLLLHEDMAQVEFYDSMFVLDVGWYPEFSLDGRFILYVIRNSDWEHPVLRLEVNQVAGLRKAIDLAVLVIKKCASLFSVAEPKTT